MTTSKMDLTMEENKYNYKSKGPIKLRATDKASASIAIQAKSHWWDRHPLNQKQPSSRRNKK